MPRFSFDHPQGQDLPTVMGRQPVYGPKCKVCNIVPALQMDLHYSWDDAIDVEKDVYYKLLTFWPHTEISEWLERKHGLSISHDSITRHAQNHITNPEFDLIERMRGYRKKHARSKFLKSLVDIPHIMLDSYRTGLVEGRVDIRPQDALKALEIVREWEKDEDDSTERLMQALHQALSDTPMEEETRAAFIENMQTALQQLEEGEEEIG